MTAPSRSPTASAQADTVTPRAGVRGMGGTRLVISGDDRFGSAMRDLGAAFLAWRIWGILGLTDTRSRYRRTVLGPVWITLSIAIQSLAIGLIFSGLFGIALETYLPYVTLGLLVWQFMSGTAIEAANAFAVSSNLIRNLPLPLGVHVLRVVWRNLLASLHHLVFVALIAPFTAIVIGPTALWALLGMVLIVVNITWVAFLLALVSVRFRDIPPMVASAVQVLFFVTPVIWSPERLGPMLGFLTLNPAYHMIEIVRDPLLGVPPSALSLAIAIGSAVIGWAAALAVYGRYQWRIAYWI